MLAAPQSLASRIGAIREIADIADGEAPCVAFRRVVPASRSPMRPPLFLLGDVAALDTGPLFRPLGNPDLGCYSLRNAVVAPTGIAVQDGVAFCSASFIHPRHHVETIAARLNRERPRLREVPGPVAVIDGPGQETWGHWLCDFLPRLSVLYDAGWDIGALRFAVPPDLPPFAQEMLRLCGIGQDRQIVYRPWKELLAPELLLMPTGPRLVNRLSPYFAEATRFWQRRVLHRLAVPRWHGSGRYYLSRNSAQRQMLNRNEIEHEAKRRGLRVVRPEALSIAEQIALFQGARVLVGEYGSALHNSVFSPPGTMVCGLRGTSRHPDFYQSGIATALDQLVGYVLGDTSGQDVEQRFTIAPEAFHAAMDIVECA